MVTVTTVSGAQPVDGSGFDVTGGILTVTADDGTSLAAFAGGVWQSVIVVPS